MGLASLIIGDAVSMMIWTVRRKHGIRWPTGKDEVLRGESIVEGRSYIPLERECVWVGAKKGKSRQQENLGGGVRFLKLGIVSSKGK